MPKNKTREIGDKGEKSYIGYCNKHKIGWLHSLDKPFPNTIYYRQGLFKLIESLYFGEKYEKDFVKKILKKKRKLILPLQEIPLL